MFVFGWAHCDSTGCGVLSSNSLSAGALFLFNYSLSMYLVASDIIHCNSLSASVSAKLILCFTTAESRAKVFGQSN